jgi:dTDP-4-dehydrorhamnose 3,5-epimerase-like enzyme
MVFIPSGLAHGFLSLQDDSCVVYLQTSVYSPDHDAGIRFNSFGMEWEVKEPIISPRDQQFPRLSEFDSPFIFEDRK